MKSSKTLIGVAALAVAAILCLALAGESAKAQGSECGSCNGRLNSVTGSGTGTNCSQALANAHDDALDQAYDGDPSCWPCQISNGSQACYAIDSIPPTNLVGATWTLYYRCET